MSTHNVSLELARATVSGTVATTPIIVTRHFASSTEISTNHWVFINTTTTSYLITDIRVASAVVATGDCRLGFIVATSSGAISGNDVCSPGLQIGNATTGSTVAYTASLSLAAVLTSTTADKTVVAGGKLSMYLMGGSPAGITSGGVVTIEMVPVV